MLVGWKMGRGYIPVSDAVAVYYISGETPCREVRGNKVTQGQS